MSHEMNVCKSVSVCEDGCRFYLSVKCPSIFQIRQKENSQNLLFIEVLRVFLEVPGEPFEISQPFTAFHFNCIHNTQKNRYIECLC